MHAELSIDSGEVVSDGARAQEQLRRDVGRPGTQDDETEDFPLTGAEIAEGGIRPPLVADRGALRAACGLDLEADPPQVMLEPGQTLL